MNPSRLQDFKQQAARIVQPIAASPRRKHDMRDELLAHMWESYEREFLRLANEDAAAEKAAQSLGNPDELRRQLQHSVPFVERTIFMCLGETENPMYRFLWIVGIVTLIIALNFAFPFREEVHLTAVGLICGLCVWHLRKQDNLAARWLGPRWPWWVGAFAIFLGPGMILPALAKLKQGGPSGFFFPLGLGVLITLCGVGFLVQAIRNRRIAA